MTRRLFHLAVVEVLSPFTSLRPLSAYVYNGPIDWTLSKLARRETDRLDSRHDDVFSCRFVTVLHESGHIVNVEIFVIQTPKLGFLRL